MNVSIQVHCKSTGTIHQRSNDGLSQEYHVEDSCAIAIVGKKLFSTPSPVYSGKRNRDLDGADMISHDSMYALHTPEVVKVDVQMGKSADEVFEKSMSPATRMCDILSAILAREEYLDYIELYQLDLNSWAYSEIFGIPTNVNRHDSSMYIIAWMRMGSYFKLKFDIMGDQQTYRMKLAMELVNNQFNQFADLIRNNAEQSMAYAAGLCLDSDLLNSPLLHIVCDYKSNTVESSVNPRKSKLLSWGHVITKCIHLPHEGKEEPPPAKLSVSSFHPSRVTCEVVPWVTVTNSIWQRTRYGGDMQTQSHSVKGKGKQPMSDEAVKNRPQNNQLHPPLLTTTLTLGKRLTEERKSAASKPNKGERGQHVSKRPIFLGTKTGNIPTIPKQTNQQKHKSHTITKIIKSMAAKVTWNQQSIKDPSIWCLPPSFTDSIEDAETLNITVEYGEQSNLGWRSLFLNAAFAVLHNHMSLDYLTWLRYAFMDMFTMFFIQLVTIKGVLDIVVS
ncbi:hypothetical protein RJT34_16340 [Clitoria ternatea]|uniref:Uncharacterized protein n=1 Tax=Clitoria ternatea TaxID=43366 RepID=A0AAN9J862_CLITE